MNSSSNDYSGAIAAFAKAKHIVVGSHYNPDGDAIGCTLALGRALEQQGKKVTLYNRDGVPPSLQFFTNSDRIVKNLPKEEPFDLVVMVDVAHFSRVGGDFEKGFGKIKTIVIDHHELSGTDGDIEIVDPKAAACGIMILELIDQMSISLDAEMAEYLYGAIGVDTGFFRYSNTSSKVLAIASRLVETGASPSAIAQEIHENYPLERLYLLGKALQTLEVDQKLGYASMAVTHKMLQEAKASDDITEGLTIYPRSIQGVKVSAFFRELEEKGKVRVSLRSKGKINISPLAKQFEGGGHPYAAGCTIEGSLEEVQRKVKEAVQKLLNG